MMVEQNHGGRNSFKAHILVHKQAAERTHWGWYKSFKTSKLTFLPHTSSLKTTPPDPQICLPDWDHTFKYMSQQGHSHPKHIILVSFSSQ